MSTRSGASKVSKPQQARDNDRDMLINRMMAKYNKYPNAAAVVRARVTRFMSQSRITDANLKKLEKEILEVLTAKPKAPVAPKEQHKEVKRVPPIQKKPEIVPQEVSQHGDEEDNFEWEKKEIPYNNDKQWDEIMKFNEKAYKDEQVKEEMKKMEKKKLLKVELEKQIEEKEKHKRGNKDHGGKAQEDQLTRMMDKDKERTLQKEKQKLRTKEMLEIGRAHV